MRQLKFRAWDKVDKRMITHEQKFIPLKVTSMGVLRLRPDFIENLWELVSVERFELMQFTGMTDKNGVDIYEGDIMMSPAAKPDSNIRVGVVEYADHHAQFELVSSEYAQHMVDVRHYIIDGNIYENPKKQPF